MLSPIHKIELKSFCSSLQGMLALKDIELLKADFVKLDSEFKTKIMPLQAEVSEIVSDSQWVSYLTEMHKQMRLLQVELTFLASARQPDKVEERFCKVHQCLENLQAYCQALLEK